MLRHNIKLAFRNFKKDKSTFLINLIGLSTGLACAIMIFMWVNDELSMDKFHKNDDRLFHVMSNIEIPNGMMTWVTTPAPLAAALKKEMPEVKTITSSSGRFGKYSLSLGNVNLNGRGMFVPDNYFQVFSFEMIEGNAEQLFPNKNGIVISEDMATKLFKSSNNAIGKSISYQSPIGKGEAIISGVFENTPQHSSQQFDFLLPYQLFLDNGGDGLHWGNLTVQTYAILQDDVDVSQFNDKIAKFLRPKRDDLKVDIMMQPYSQGYLYGNYENGVVTGGRITYVKLFSLIALFILLIACINFMNLTTANATKKFKEIGVKKTIGADRKTLIFQYLSESLILSFFSLLIAIVLIYFALPSFNLITGKMLSLNLGGTLLFSILGITFFTGILSGSYPAFYLSGFNPVDILKGRMNNSWGELWARKGLVVFQFSLSIILIVSVMVVYQQIAFIQDKKLGFNKDNVIHFPISQMDSLNLERMTAQIKNIPGVVNASSMAGNFINQTAFTDGPFNWKGKTPSDEVGFSFLGVNYDALEMLEFKMVEGRSFSKKFNNEDAKIIFNEAAIKSMGLENPIGETFKLWRNDLEIVGVVKDFHFTALYDKINPFFIILNSPQQMDKMLVKIQAGNEKSTLAELESLYKKSNPNSAFEYQFLDSDYQRMYESESRISTLSKYFAGFAIIISCLGLFGLAAFTAQRRVKEISIRKVLGANPFSIVWLLTFDFTKMVLIAMAIGLPLSYFIARRWLDDFAFSIDLSIWFFVVAGVLTLTIAWLTISLQTVKAASVNPSDNLKE